MIFTWSRAARNITPAFPTELLRLTRQDAQDRYQAPGCQTQLVRHILTDHFQPEILGRYKVPRYDIELLVLKPELASMVIAGLGDHLNLSDQEIQGKVAHRREWYGSVPDWLTPEAYRELAAKSILYCALLGLGELDPAILTRIGRETLALNLSHDAHDEHYALSGSFWNKYLRNQANS